MSRNSEAPEIAPLPQALVEPIVRAALLEDLGLGGDVTSDAIVTNDRRALATIVAHEAGTIAGVDVATLAFRLLDHKATIDVGVRDGERVEAGGRIVAVAGEARAVLAAERTAINFLAHLSGVASATAAYVAAVAGTRAVISETRKTTPGLRALEKYAVRAGGGRNHRFRLDDAILIKDNHIAIAGGVGPALAAAHARVGHLMKIEIEVDSLAQLDEVCAHCDGVDTVLLDNFSVHDMEEAVRRVRGRMVVEASGGVNLDNVAAIAATGVDVISIGALTHSARALDLGLDVVAA